MPRNVPTGTPKESANGISSIADSPNEGFSLYGTSPEPRFAFIEADILASNLPTTARISLALC